MKKIQTIASLFLIVFIITPCVFPASLLIDTDFKISGVSYSNFDYDSKTSTDAISYYTQRLRLGIGGKFSPGIKIQTVLQSLSVAGSSAPFPSEVVWQRDLPYPFIDGTPFIENLYFRIDNAFDQPFDIVFGRQPLDYGDGLFSDNTSGLMATRFIIKYPENFTGDLFMAKVSENFRGASDFDVYGIAGSYKHGNDIFKAIYLYESDRSGRVYTQGATSKKTSKIIKNFYGGRLLRIDDFGEYKIGIAKQTGELKKESGSNISLDGFAWDVSGILRAKKTKVGDVSAGLLLSMFSGDDDATSINDKDEAFRPTLAKRFDGLEPIGYGKLFAANMNTSAIDIHEGYSGINTIGLIFEFSPFFRWTFGINYFLFSASEHPLKLSVSASGFEKLLGAKYSLGVEMDLYMKFIHSKYIDAYFGYFRYTPPPEVFWEKREPLSKYQVDINVKF